MLMHENFILHRDLKSQNILIGGEGNAVIIDFGLSRFYGQNPNPMTRNVQTLYYRAPEVLLGARYYSDKIDIWSLGCIYSEMILGRILFRGESEVD